MLSQGKIIKNKRGPNGKLTTKKGNNSCSTKGRYTKNEWGIGKEYVGNKSQMENRRLKSIKHAGKTVSRKKKRGKKKGESM